MVPLHCHQDINIILPPDNVMELREGNVFSLGVSLFIGGGPVLPLTMMHWTSTYRDPLPDPGPPDMGPHCTGDTLGSGVVIGKAPSRNPHPFIGAVLFLKCIFLSQGRCKPK